MAVVSANFLLGEAARQIMAVSDKTVRTVVPLSHPDRTAMRFWAHVLRFSPPLPATFLMWLRAGAMDGSWTWNTPVTIGWLIVDYVLKVQQFFGNGYWKDSCPKVSLLDCEVVT